MSSSYYYEDNIEKIKNNIQKYKDKLKPDINLAEHVSKFINNNFDLMYYMLELDLHHISEDRHNIYTRISSAFNKINRIAHRLDTTELSEEDLTTEYEEYISNIDDMLFALDMALSYTRYSYVKLEDIGITPSGRDAVIRNILNKYGSTNKCSLLDLSSLSKNSTALLDLFQDKDFYPNVEYYVWRSSLDYYNRFKDVAYRFIAGTPDGCKISNNVFDIVYSIPQYTQFAGGTRTVSFEKEYVRNVLKYVKNDGIVILEYNRCRLTKDICSLLAKYLYNVNIIADNYPYETVLIVGNKRKDKTADQELYSRLRRLFRVNEMIEDDLSNLYISHISYNVDMFKGTLFNDEMKNTVCDESKLFETLYNDIFKPNEGVSNKHPMLPFSVGQLGLVLTSGCLNGAIKEHDEETNKDFYHVIKGCVIKQTEKVYKENKVSEETISNKVNINIITPTGDILRLA